MTRKVGKILVIEAEDDKRCATCKKLGECRPYGNGGALICHPCMMKTPASRKTAEQAFKKRMG